MPEAERHAGSQDERSSGCRQACRKGRPKAHDVCPPGIRSIEGRDEYAPEDWFRESPHDENPDRSRNAADGYASSCRHQDGRAKEERDRGDDRVRS